MHESKTRLHGKFHIIDEIGISKGWNRMALSKASCTGRGVTPAIGGHVHHMFDGDEDDLFALSLGDVMVDRPWTADELMGGGARPSSPNPSLAPKPAAAPAPAPIPAPAPATMPAPRPASDPSETAAFLAAAQHVAPKQPVADLDDFATRQFAFDSWAAADLDETSAGVPTFNEPVNPLVAASTFEYEPDTNAEAVSTSSYTDSADDYFGDYYAEEESPRFSEFNPVAKIIFTAIVVALLGVIAFEGFQLFRGPAESESATQQQEDESNDYLDINNLEGDPNDGDE